MLFWYCFSVPIHELGHSWAAWLSGRFSIPVGALIPMAGFAHVREERSILVFMALCGILWVFGRLEWQERKAFPVLICSTLSGAALYLTWLAPAPQVRMLISYGGHSAEFILSTLLVVSFYYRFPDRMRGTSSDFHPFSSAATSF